MGVDGRVIEIDGKIHCPLRMIDIVDGGEIVKGKMNARACHTGSEEGKKRG